MSLHEITDSNFLQEVTNHSGFVLIDFWAPWCGPCKQLTPIIEEVAVEMKGKVKFCKMNVDDNPEMPSKFGIRGIPALILFQDGKQVASKIGSMPKSTLVEWINSEVS